MSLICSDYLIQIAPYYLRCEFRIREKNCNWKFSAHMYVGSTAFSTRKSRIGQDIIACAGAKF